MYPRSRLRSVCLVYMLFIMEPTCPYIMHGKSKGYEPDLATSRFKKYYHFMRWLFDNTHTYLNSSVCTTGVIERAMVFTGNT